VTLGGDDVRAVPPVRRSNKSMAGRGEPRPTAAPSPDHLLELQQTLYASRNPTRRWLHCMRRDWIIGAIDRCRSPRPRAALEVGPGSGIYLPVLAAAFDRVVASDVEPEFLEHARSLAGIHGNIFTVEDDIQASALPEATFDLILCTEVIEHIANSKAVLANIRRLLKPGGMLILSTPQRYSLLEIAARAAFLPGVIDIVRVIYREPIIATGHINLMTARALRRELEQAGFVINEQFTSGLYLPLVAEFLGRAGLAFERSCERLLRRVGLTGILWTQFYVAIGR